MLWVIRNSDIGLLVSWTNNEECYFIDDSSPLLFDTFKEACLWIAQNLENAHDIYSVIAYLP